jgi:hypothetical protein
MMALDLVVRFVAVEPDYRPDAGMLLSIRNGDTGPEAKVATSSPWGRHDWSERAVELPAELGALRREAYEMDVVDILVSLEDPSLWQRSWGELDRDITYSRDYDPAAGLGDEVLLVLSSTYDPPERVTLATVFHLDAQGDVNRLDGGDDIPAEIERARELARQLDRPLMVRLNGRVDWSYGWGILQNLPPEPGRPLSFGLDVTP